MKTRPEPAQSFDGASTAAAPSVQQVITETPPRVVVGGAHSGQKAPTTSKYYQAGYKQVDLPHHQFGNDIGGGVPEFDRETRPAHIPGQQKVGFGSKPCQTKDQAAQLPLFGADGKTGHPMLGA